MIACVVKLLISDYELISGCYIYDWTISRVDFLNYKHSEELKH